MITIPSVLGQKIEQTERFMSNNILYLVNDEDESIFPLAKSMANGWYRNQANGSAEEYVAKLFLFLSNDNAGFTTHGESDIRVMTDFGDLPEGYRWFNQDPPRRIHFHPVE